jgi:predicted component of type VI protein secretion system
MPDVDDVATLMRISKYRREQMLLSFRTCVQKSLVFIRSLKKALFVIGTSRTDTHAGKLWSALCGQADSEYIGMTIPRFLSRLPYGSDTDPLDTFSFEEFDDAPIHDQYVWSNTAFIAAQLMAESYSAYGWEMGRALKQDVDGLPTHIYKEQTETVYNPAAKSS